MTKAGIIVLCLICFLWGKAQSYIEVVQEPINTNDYSEIAPFIYKNGLLFTSNKKTSAIQSTKTTDNKFFYDVYYFQNDKSLKTPIDSILHYINSPFHDGPAIAWGDTFIVSQNFYINGGKKHKAPVGLFFYDFSNSYQPKIKAFPYNNKYYRVGHPCLSPDGRFLYFSSDMPGGYGGFDIYVSEKKDTTWDSPKNLGKSINSAKDEISPYLIVHRLYFSSNRDSIKKFDIYFSEQENMQWQPAVPLSEPINSFADDIFFICDSSFEKGYFSSNRKKSDDIYRFYSNLPVFEKCDTMIEKNLCYHFLDETSQYLDTLPVIYEWDFGDSTQAKGWEVDHCFNDYGNYFVKLIMIDTISNEIQEVANYDLMLEKTVQPYITHPDSIVVGQNVLFDGQESFYPNGSIKLFVWMFSDGYKATGQTCERKFNKPGIHSVKLGFVAIDNNNVEVKKCATKTFEVVNNE